MLYKYSGNKFKVNDTTIVSDGDILTVRKGAEQQTAKGINYSIEIESVINNTTGKEIPTDILHNIITHLKPLYKDAGDIDEVEETIEVEGNNRVSHPSHYTWLKDLCGIEVIDITRHLDFDLGNAIKYILRCGHKSENGYTNKEKTIEDLRKAVWYLNDKIKMLNE